VTASYQRVEKQIRKGINFVTKLSHLAYEKKKKEEESRRRKKRKREEKRKNCLSSSTAFRFFLCGSVSFWQIPHF